MIAIIFLCFFIGCTTSYKKEVSNSDIGIENISLEQINYGPTNENATSFIDKTTQYGLDGVEADNFNIVDINLDGYPDLVILENYISFPAFYEYDKDTKKFKKLSYSPLPKDVKASHLYFYDIDKDNILDVLVGVLNRKSEVKEKPIRLFKGHFKDGKLFFKDSGLKIGEDNYFTSTVNLFDFDLDGDLDIFIGNWFSIEKNNPISQHDVLLENNEGYFEDVTDKLEFEKQRSVDGAYVNARPTFASSICDIDQNGFPDILTASTNGFSNKLWLNRYKLIKKERYFQDFGISTMYGGDSEGNLTKMGGGRTFTSICTDYNNDSIMDVFLGELYHNYDSAINDKSSILTGASLKFPPSFIRTEYFLDNEDIQWHQADRRGIWFDYNNDGLIDLLVDNSGYPPHSRLILFKQLSDHSFVNMSKEDGINIVNPQSTVIADFNQDGKMDFLTAQSNMRDKSIKRRIYLFENNVDTNDNQSIRVHLNGNKSNLSGLGAMVILKVSSTSGSQERRQFVDYSYGGLAPQNEEGIHFGLKGDEKIDFIKVRWPYSNKLNAIRSKMEKIYKIKNKFTFKRDVTLCEDGRYFEGKKNCN